MLPIFLLKISAVSTDCTNVITFASGLGMPVNQPVLWSALQGDCCTAPGVTCVGQTVTQIDWNTRNLNGIINGTAIPSGLNALYLHVNQLSGGIPLSLPSGLILLFLHTNQLTGSIPLSLPSGLTSLFLLNNQLTGGIPSSFPSGLAYLFLENNQLTGSIPSFLPSGLIYLHLFNNLLTGGIPFLLPSALTSLRLYNNQLTGGIPPTLPSGLTILYLHINRLTGEVPLFPSTLQHLALGYPGYSGNRFTGTVKLNQPIELYINDNWITDVIIQDTSKLTFQCDLSNNPLLGNINIAALTNCTQTALYNASLLPNTLTTSEVFTTHSSATTINKWISLVEQTMSNEISTLNSISLMTIVSLFAPTTNTQNEENAVYTLPLQDVFSSTSILSIYNIDVVHSTTSETSIMMLYSAVAIKPPMTILQLFQIILRLLINAVILGIIIKKTPFKREWKFVMKRKGNDRMGDHLTGFK